jgi:hypothetical protein
MHAVQEKNHLQWSTTYKQMMFCSLQDKHLEDFRETLLLND